MSQRTGRNQMNGGAGSVTFKRREFRRNATTAWTDSQDTGLDLNDSNFFEKIRAKINQDEMTFSD